MRIHLAGAEARKELFMEYKPPYILFTFANCQGEARQKDMVELAHAPWCKRILCDSGAFTFFAAGKEKTEKEWERYIDMYCDFVVSSGIKDFFELDLDQIVGLQKVEEYRRRIEKRTGMQSIPVWHINRGWDYFKRMCDEYSYVSIGGVAKTANGPKIVKTFPWFIDYAHKTNTEIHGLGFTDTVKLKEYQFDSIDSSSWTAGGRYGKIYQIKGNAIRITSITSPEERKKGIRAADYKKMDRHNLQTWVQFARMKDI